MSQRVLIDFYSSFYDSYLIFYKFNALVHFSKLISIALWLYELCNEFNWLMSCFYVRLFYTENIGQNDYFNNIMKKLKFINLVCFVLN